MLFNASNVNQLCSRPGKRKLWKFVSPKNNFLHVALFPRIIVQEEKLSFKRTGLVNIFKECKKQRKLITTAICHAKDHFSTYFITLTRNVLENHKVNAHSNTILWWLIWFRKGKFYNNFNHSYFCL